MLFRSLTVKKDLTDALKKLIAFYLLSSFQGTKKKKLHHNVMRSFESRRPTLTGGNPQLPSALKSLTAVFGMGTGVTSSLSPPNNKGTLFLQN